MARACLLRHSAQKRADIASSPGLALPGLRVGEAQAAGLFARRGPQHNRGALSCQRDRVCAPRHALGAIEFQPRGDTLRFGSADRNEAQTNRRWHHAGDVMTERATLKIGDDDQFPPRGGRRCQPVDRTPHALRQVGGIEATMIGGRLLLRRSSVSCHGRRRTLTIAGCVHAAAPIDHDGACNQSVPSCETGPREHDGSGKATYRQRHDRHPQQQQDHIRRTTHSDCRRPRGSYRQARKAHAVGLMAPQR
jgi:hypothetical protein